ncbi:Rdx family-domain-containing protein [Apiospora marii]|uniref:Rdx family-domain-containing protein n=1 Tax=Apiospora marii TaxID=335849 RepID=A0ABR1S686_9PEZI
MAEITTSSAPASDPAPSSGGISSSTTNMLPRVTIRFCTQCKWMLRAAYFAQELLSTFSTGLGEVALQPSTGGTFIVEITAAVTPSSNNNNDAQRLPGGGAGAVAAAAATQHRVLWDRTVDGGFPETKELKRRVRDVIEPNRDLGHVDRDHARKPKPAAATAAPSSSSHEAPGSAAAAAAATQDSALTSSSAATPTVTQDTPRQGQSHPAAGPSRHDHPRQQ